MAASVYERDNCGGETRTRKQNKGEKRPGISQRSSLVTIGPLYTTWTLNQDWLQAYNAGVQQIQFFPQFLASHTGVFMGARISSLPSDETRAPLKTPAWEATQFLDTKMFLTQKSLKCATLL